MPRLPSDRGLRPSRKPQASSYLDLEPGTLEQWEGDTGKGGREVCWARPGWHGRLAVTCKV
jgi:hypothetical protein